MNDELKSTVAANIIRLRTEMGLTQAKLGEKLNYSDKTVSKWERGEALPDAVALKNMGEIFHVPVDNLLSPPEKWTHPALEHHRYSHKAITIVSLLGIWTFGVLLFVVLWLTGTVHWMIFPYCVPVSLITLLVFNSVWNNGHRNFWIVSGLVLSIITVMYLMFLWFNPWQLFLILVPAELLVLASFRIRKNMQKR